MPCPCSDVPPSLNPGGHSAEGKALRIRNEPGDPEERFSEKFLLVAISFIVFDLEGGLLSRAVEIAGAGGGAFGAVSSHVRWSTGGTGPYDWKKGGTED